jgi:hypothetical protein
MRLGHLRAPALDVAIQQYPQLCKIFAHIGARLVASTLIEQFPGMDKERCHTVGVRVQIACVRR